MLDLDQKLILKNNIKKISTASGGSFLRNVSLL